jgi:transposase
LNKPDPRRWGFGKGGGCGVRSRESTRPHAEIEQTSREIDARAKEDAYVEVLCQIRGVGRYIAMLVIAEVGEISRFPSARHLCAWAGLTPTVRSSDGKARLGHISGQGSPALRWALVEAAQHAPTGGGSLRAA